MDINKDTKFPRTSYSNPIVSKKDIEQWIKRCICDAPECSLSDSWDEWFEKWFTQFDPTWFKKDKEES